MLSSPQARVSAPAPTLAWPTRIDEARAMAWLRRRLSGVDAAQAQLYHHPMLAASYEVRKRDGSSNAHAIVDLVGGRAYAADPWEHIAFVPIAEVMASVRATKGSAATGKAGTTSEGSVAAGEVGTSGPEEAAVAAGDSAAVVAGTIADPVRIIDDERAERAARDLVRSFLLRGRKLGPPGKLHVLREPFLFGKPNWWLTGTRDGKPVEVILDGLTGRHYALKA